jgi:hypothetical protein
MTCVSVAAQLPHALKERMRIQRNCVIAIAELNDLLMKTSQRA